MARHFQHFQHFETTQGYFSVWKKVETGRFLLVIGHKKKRLALTGLATDESLNSFVRSDFEKQSRCQQLTNAFKGMATLGID